MTKIKIILIFIICNCTLNSQTYKVIRGDTSVYLLVPCIGTTGSTPRWECYYERTDLKDGFYTIYYKTDTSKLYETFYIKNKNKTGLNKMYNKSGSLVLVRKWKNERVKLDSSFYDTGEIASIHKVLIGSSAKQIFSYTKSFYKNGNLLEKHKVGFFIVIDVQYCENGKINSYSKHRKRDNKMLKNIEYNCE